MNTGGGPPVNHREQAKSGLDAAVHKLVEAVGGLDDARAAILTTVPLDDGTMFTPAPVTTDPPLYDHLEIVTRLGEEARDVLGRVAAANAGVQALPAAPDG